MRYWLDTEFIEDGETIDLISIGIVAEDGRELYLQYIGFNMLAANDWIQNNVFPHLVVCPFGPLALGPSLRHHYNGQCQFYKYPKETLGNYAECPWRSREQLKHEILHFMDIEKYGKPELWGWCAGHDFVAFCQLFGTMMDMPKGYPHYIKDFQYVLDERGITDEQLPEQGEGLHNALADAHHLKRLWGSIVRNDALRNKEAL